MSIKEADRARILSNVQEGLTLKKAAKLLGLSYAQTKRIWSRYKKEGSLGLISKKRGKKSNRAVPESRRQEIVKIIAANYYDCKPLFVSEKLEERHSMKYSSEFIRQLMIEHHLWVPNTKKIAIHQRRLRRECEGELVQMDASDHCWFEDRGPRCHLHLLIDDATSKIYGGFFTVEETMEGYFQACLPYFRERGLPRSFYVDKRGTFKVNQGKKKGITQFTRAMSELGIEMIFAHSPQAKGRIERAFGTLQERLIWEMRIERISTIEDANRFLPHFFKKHNKQFTAEPANPFNAHRPLSPEQDLKYILCKKERRIVTKNLEVHYKNTVYQLIVPKELSGKLVKKKIDVLEVLDGEVSLHYEGMILEHKKYHDLPYKEEPLGLLNGWKDHKKWVPPLTHPWKRGAKRVA